MMESELYCVCMQVVERIDRHIYIYILSVVAGVNEPSKECLWDDPKVFLFSNERKEPLGLRYM